MRILIDLQGAQGSSRYRGIGRYSISLAKAVVKNKGEHDVFIILNGMLWESIEIIRAEFLDLIPQDKILVWNAAPPVNPMAPETEWKNEAAKLIRQNFINKLRPDATLITSLFEGFGDDAVHSINPQTDSGITAVIQYDLIPLIQSEQYLDPNPRYKQFYFENINYLKKADLLLAISESSQKEAIELLAIPENKTANIGAAADDIFQKIYYNKSQNSRLKTKLNINRSFILYSGATDERKNHLRLIEAFSLLPQPLRESHQLVIVGRLPDEHKALFEKKAYDSGLRKTDVIVTGEVSDKELLHLYNICSLFVFPSWHEGFGLPALEAMSCGAPVIASNTSSLPEVVGNVNALFDPFNTHDICNKIKEVLRNQDLLKSLSDSGLRQASKFSWDKSASKCIYHLERIFKKTQSANNIYTDSHITNNSLNNLIEKISRIESPDRKDEDLIIIAQAIADNSINRKDRYFFVDISELVHRDAKSGIQRVVRSILSELTATPPSGFTVQPVYALSGENGYRHASEFMRKLHGLSSNNTSENDELIEITSGDFFLGLDLQHHIVIDQEPYYSYLRRQGVYVYFVVYDLLPILHPHFFPEGTNLIHARWLNILAMSDGLLCISKSVADEIHDWLTVFGPKRRTPLHISWFHLGADVSSSIPTKGLPDNAHQVLKDLNSRKSFLSVGTIEPRKGQMQTLLAFEDLWKRGVDVNLVLVGKSGWKVEALVERLRNHPEKLKRLFWLEGISDEYLEMVYSASTCLIAASEGEGFGLPLIEAAQHHKPIIARDIPVFKEVAGDHAYYFSGLGHSTLSDSIAEWIVLYDNGTAPSSDGMNWLSWKESASRLSSVIINNNWYLSWTRTNSYRFWGSHDRLGTHVGARRGKNISTTGKSGFLFFGPYLPVAPGRFRLAITGTAYHSDLLGSHIDIAAKKGTIFIAKFNLQCKLDGQFIIHREIDVLEFYQDLEIRLWVTDNVHADISSLEITPIETDASNEPRNEKTTCQGNTHELFN